MTTAALLQDNPNPDDNEIRHALEGNLCRCTGYENIVRAVRYAAEHSSVEGNGAMHDQAKPETPETAGEIEHPRREGDTPEQAGVGGELGGRECGARHLSFMSC